MAILLGHWGFEVKVARSGGEALQSGTACAPDVILLDIGMPGMDGLEVARRIRQQAPAHKKRPFLIAISGYADGHTREQAREAGVDVYLVKPVEPVELEKLLRRFQRVVMPAAERRICRAHPYPRRMPTLRYWSDRAVLRASIATAAQTVAAGRELHSQLWTMQSRQERLELRRAWCQQVAPFLDESERVRQSLISFQKCGIA